MKTFAKRSVLVVDSPEFRRIAGRIMCHDVAIPFRMQAGFPGDVNRTHPFSIEPAQVDATNPPTAYGQPVVLDATSHNVRRLLASDSALTAIYGITVRPYPFQQSTGGYTASFGVAVPPTGQPIDVLRSGYIMVQVYGSPTKGLVPFIWVAANSGNHIQDVFEIATGGGSNTIQLTTQLNTTFNGPSDSGYGPNTNVNNAELAFNI